jgi:hypothetical protein
MSTVICPCCRDVYLDKGFCPACDEQVLHPSHHARLERKAARQRAASEAELERLAARIKGAE